MPMFFLDKRAQVICNELKKESVHQKVALSSWEMKKGNFVTPADALADPSPFTPFDGRTMHWYGPDEHYWFRADMTVPESFDGKTLVFHLRTRSKSGMMPRIRSSCSLWTVKSPRAWI